jgi:hypothetical protein
MTEESDPLAAEPFAYQVFKGDRVTITHKGISALTLRGRKAVQFCNKVEDQPWREQQLVMAKVTGQFKMGNEKANVPKY